MHDLSVSKRRNCMLLLMMGSVMYTPIANAQLADEFKMKPAQVMPDVAHYVGTWSGVGSQHTLRLVITQISQQQVKGQLWVGTQQIPFRVPMKISKIPYDYQFKFTLSEHEYPQLQGQYTWFLDVKSGDKIRANWFRDDQAINFMLSPHR